MGLSTDPTAQRAPADTILVLFGASGDLAARKLLPGLFHLFAEDAPPGRFRLLAVSRRPLDDDDVREHARRAIEEFGGRSTEGWGTGFEVAPAGMRMELSQDGLLEAYERLLLDAMAGDQTLFADPRTVERLWEAAAPVLNDPPEPESYEPGSWGPPSASEMTDWTLR